MSFAYHMFSDSLFKRQRGSVPVLRSKMNSRTLANFWRLHSIHLTKHLTSTTWRSYAICTEQPCFTPVNELFRSYSIKPELKEGTSNFRQAINKLQTDFANHGNVHPENFKKILESLPNKGSLSAEQSIFLLEACAELMPSLSSIDRMKLFYKLWQHLKMNGELKKQHFISFLKVHAANGIPLEDFRKFLEESKYQHDPEMYEKLVQFACELGDLKLTTEIISEMRTKGFTLTENVFNALILGHSRNKDLKGALAVLETMNAAGVKWSTATYAELIGAYVENGEIEKAIETLQKCSGHLGTAQVVKLIKCLATGAKANNQKLIELLVKHLSADFLNSKELPSSIRNLCAELIYSGRVDEAYKIIEAFPRPNFNENQDIDTFAVTFLQDLFRSKVNHEKIIQIVKNLKESDKNIRAIHIACESVMRRDPEHAISYLEALSEIEPLRPHYFWPLLLHNFRQKGEVGILDTLKIMSGLDVECDYETLSFYVLPRLSITLNNVQQAVKTLENCGLKASQMLTSIIAQLIFQQKLEDVVKIANMYTSKLDTKKLIRPLTMAGVSIRATKRYQQYSAAIHTLHLKSEDSKIDFAGQILVELIGNNKLSNDIVMLDRIIMELSRLGTRIAPAALEIIVGHLVKFQNGKTDINNIRNRLKMMADRKLSLPISENAGSSIVHPRDMSYEELECHLVELETKGMNLRGVLRRLLQTCVKDGRLERALEVKQKCDQAKVELSPGMLASIFDMYIKLEDYSAATTTYDHLLKAFPGFLLDEHKVLDFATLAVKKDKIEEAKELLRSRASSRKVFGGDYVIKNVWNLLTNVAQFAAKQTDLPKDTNLTKEFFFFIKKLGYCKSHNAILGPIIREYIYRKDIRSAVAEFKTLVEIFGHTPLQFELTSLLVKLSNGNNSEYTDVSSEDAKELLNQLTTTISSIHGLVNMNSSLLLAIAESGTENQLRKLLINPDFRINQEMLNQNCEHLNKEGSIRTLMRLAKSCRGLGHIIKEQDIYDMLLMKFINDNNYLACLELFENLEADDEFKMSQEFLNNLVNLLKVNKIKVPSSLALRAQIM